MDGHVGEFLAPACPVYHGDTGVGKTPPPKVLSVRHSGAMAGSDLYVLAHRAMQEECGAK